MKNRILFFLWLLNVSIYAVAQNGAEYEYLKMASSPFRVDESYLSKHDIVYLSPTQLQAEGFPMGNGNVGGLIWNTDEGIEMQINKNDLWTAPVANEGNISILKHAARLKIDFGTPVFSWIHLKQFEGRLSLQKGEATYKGNTAYSTTTVNSWLVQGKNIWVLECENTPDKNFLGENLTATVMLERMGSRAFPGWYGGGYSKDVAAGLGKTQPTANGSDMILEETADGLHFAVACRILEEPAAPLTVNTHRMEQRTQKSKFTILISVVTDKEAPQPVEAARQLLDEAQASGLQTLKAEKDNWYRNFWSNSFMKLGNDYLENIYYLRRYLMAAGSQGQYPVAFNGGLWRWNRDVMNWVTPHHWNTQQQYWGLAAQNDCQLMQPYLNTYLKMLPQAQALAKEKGASSDAILITEAHSFDGDQLGKNWGNMKNSFTSAAQVSSIFWDYYDFTGDKEFLKDKAYLFMKKAANFYLDKLQWDEAKKEYYLLSTLYESAPIDHAKNVISDRNTIEQLFKNCIKAASVLRLDKEKVKQWNHVLNHLWQRSFELVEDSAEVITPAQEYYAEKRYAPWHWASAGSIAFPTGLIGVDDKDSRLGKAVANYLKYNTIMNAHYPMSEIAARMGLGDEALRYLLKGVEIHQMYPQGLMHNVTGYPDNIYNLSSIHDLLNHSHTIRSQAFFQCGMEPISNYATAMNEMMLQSNEDKIRVFAAIPTAWDSIPLAFTLRARGAFIVSAERDKQATVTQVGIKSLKGNTCRIQNPWAGEKGLLILQAEGAKKVSFKMGKDDVVTFATKPGVEYILKRSQEQPHPQTTYTGTPNAKVKLLGDRILGKLSGWNDAIIRKE